MKNELSTEQTDAILKSLEEAVDSGPWEESNFLKVIGKNLRDIRDEFSRQINAPQEEKLKIASQVANQMALRRGQLQIFIALYSSEGANLQAWERILANLPKQMTSRPIYSNEEDIKSLIKSKSNKLNEAYISVYISEQDILPLSVDKTPLDKLGKPLLILKDKSLSLENMGYFVHITGTYEFVHGRLVKKELAE